MAKKDRVVPTLASPPMETQHVITVNDVGMAVLIAALECLITNEGDVMPDAQFKLVQQMANQFREGMEPGKQDRMPDLIMPPGYERLQ